MSKAFQLQIPKPCHENWDQMTQADKGKFCASCQKQVFDFTSMSDRELVAFFKKPSTGSVCGRFTNDQLNKELEVPRKRIPWLKYFFTIVLPTFFASSKVVAQGQVTKIVKRDTSFNTIKVNRTSTLGIVFPNIKCEKPQFNSAEKDVDPAVVGEIAPKFVEEKNITGKLSDEMGNPIAFATVIIKGTKTGTTTNSKGEFTIKSNADSLNLAVSCIGFEPTEQVIHVSGQTITLVEMVQLKTALTGELVVTRCYKPAKPLPLITRIFKDTSFKNFKFYPNPATPGSNITIEWKKSEAGDFEIQLLNQDGQTVSRKTENFVEKVNSVQYLLPQVASGNYFLVMINRKSGKRVTEKIIVQ